MPASAADEAEGKYRVRVLPNPAVGLGPYGGCGVIDPWVVVTDVGGHGHAVKVGAGKTLTVRLSPDANAFAGNVGLNWLVRLRAGKGNEVVAQSSGPAWRTEVSYRSTTAQEVQVWACNRNGHPEATVSYSVR